ncbi:MAG: DinB family protein [Candidatus Sulfotelmatobacter sp.]
MKQIKRRLASLLFLACATLASAQTSKPAEHASTPPLSAGEVIDSWISITETHLVGVADAMPEGKYSFAPSNGEFNGVRTFAEQIKHVASNNYRMAAKMLGKKPTSDQENEEGPDSAKSKAEIVEYLKASFAALHKAVASIDEKNEVEPLKGSSGTWQRARLGLAVDAIAHSFNHYGQMGGIPAHERHRSARKQMSIT